MEDGIYNAKIVDADIVYESDRGYHQIQVTVDHQFGTQAMCLPYSTDEQVGLSAVGVMKAVGVGSFSKLVGEVCRVEITDQYISGICNWHKNRWFRKSDLK